VTRVDATLTDQVTQLRHRRRVWAWTGWGSLAGWLALSWLINVAYPGTMATVLAFAWLVVSALALLGLGIAAVDTIRLHRRVKAAGGGTIQAGGSAWSGILWVLEAARLLLMLLFLVYAVIVQAEAVAYLAGSRSVDFAGVSPPIPINGDGSAIGDFVVALFWEVIFGLIFLLAGLFIHSWIQDKRQERGG
jgi:hypothetical protein